MNIPIWEISNLDMLSARQLFGILKLRADVFVVEQNCIYHDIDGKDQKALHLFGSFEREIVAYARLFKAGDYFDEASIGRVVIAGAFRDRKWGHILMDEAISAVKTEFETDIITISAQQHLKKFYEAHGFVQASDMYLEDDIPHIKMKRG